MSYGTDDSRRLERSECLELLRSVPIGRIAYTDRALPAVEPVRFAVGDNHVIFRIEEGTAPALAIQGAIVAFQADDVDGVTGDGWTVSIIGRAHAARDAAASTRPPRPTTLPPLDGTDVVYMRIPSQQISGHWIGSTAPRANGNAA
ncbi:pyridoxamine 5'-phosphate oxidase family protein [Actinomadura barringtoniae]|uniref:Pyridoxamine 5'-phosphate oxidase family protein n=1 Tax=Actinomadura barringtoniae TaxID=1427535 RepID=A0A939PUV0_9ACTN|nr:pyridoxamine 5'-phosphate oxidase family protein [Actinomadura barringtoniae]MBO2455206.1 pyridoxamine 5'-phosphate oxidase family protein [Actinomadura barringtoniae]